MSRCTDPDSGALLQAYELHALSDEDTERFRIHLLECEYCFKRFKSFQLESGLLRSDQGVREQVRRAAAGRPVPPESLFAHLGRALWPRTPLPLKPALLYLLLLIMIIPAYHGMVMLAKKGDVRTEVVNLAYGQRGMTKEDARRIELKPQTQCELIVPLEKRIRGDSLKITIEMLDGTPLWQHSFILQPGSGRMIPITLPQSKLRTMLYRLVIYDGQTDERQEVYLNIAKK